MHRHRVYLAALIFWLANNSLGAQAPGTPAPVPGTPAQTTPPTAGTPATGPALTLMDATALAIKNHPRIATAQSEAAAAGQRITVARAPFYPTIDGEITGSQALGSSRLGAGSLATSALFNRFGEGLQMSQLLTDFGRTRSLVAQSRYQAEAANRTTQATVYDVVLGVNNSYFAVLQAQAFINVANETVRARQTLADQVTTLANAQLRSQVDVSFAQVNLAEARLLLLRSQDAVSRAYADLAQAIGQDQPIQYRLTDVPAPPGLPASPEPLIADALQNRPEMQNMRLQLQAAQSFEQAEADLSRPSVTAIAVGGGLPYLDQTPRVAPHEYEAAAVNIDIPIFNGHLFSARRQAAQFQTQASQQRLRNLQQQIERDVRAAWISASTAFQRIPVTEQLLTQAQLALTLAQGRYNLGLASIVEVSQAQLNLTQAQIENVSAKYDYQSAYSALQYTIGSLR